MTTSKQVSEFLDAIDAPFTQVNMESATKAVCEIPFLADAFIKSVTKAGFVKTSSEVVTKENQQNFYFVHLQNKEAYIKVVVNSKDSTKDCAYLSSKNMKVSLLSQLVEIGQDANEIMLKKATKVQSRIKVMLNKIFE